MSIEVSKDKSVRGVWKDVRREDPGVRIRSASDLSADSQKAESAVRERWRACSEAHRSEAYHLRYIDASRRASSVIFRAKSATWQTICSNLSPRSDPRAVFRLLNAILEKRTPSKTFLFPVVVPLLTLPITMFLIFAHIYLKQHPVPRAGPNDGS